MNIDYSVVNGVGVFKIAGRLDASNVGELKNEFSSHLEQTNDTVLNLSELDAIDSTGLGGIVACLKYTAEVGGNMTIAAIGPKPRMVFEITRAYKIFDIYEDQESAIASMEVAVPTSCADGE